MLKKHQLVTREEETEISCTNFERAWQKNLVDDDYEEEE